MAKDKPRFPYWALIVLLACIALWLLALREWRALESGYALYQQDASNVATFAGVYCDGVRVDDVDLGGMSRTQASELFSNRQQAIAADFVLPIQVRGKQWRLSAKEVPMHFDAEQKLDAAFLIGHRGSFEQRQQEIRSAREGAYRFTTSYGYDREAIDGLVAIIADAVDQPAVNAALDAFNPEDKTFSFLPEQSGWKLDAKALATDILAALDAERFETVQGTGEPIEPSITLSDLEGRFGLLASYSTKTTSDRDRNTNIRISAQALSGKVVAPGETFSFNGATGKRTGEKGYREAGAIAGGVLVDDTGGGVCQTSSTLFNAVVRADLEIVKRYAHSWPSSYVPRGEDATVNWPSRDFVFRNNTAYPIFLMAGYENQLVTVEVYGVLPEDGVRITLESETVKTTKPSNDTLYTLDETLPLGTRKAGRTKHTGYLVDTYKVYHDALGNEMKRVKLWRTDYPATQNEILYH